MPNFSIHRLILVVLIFASIIRTGTELELKRIPYINLLALVALILLIPVLVSVDLTTSGKEYLSFTFEVIFFYVILSNALESQNDGFRMLRYICLGLTLIAFIAGIEKYTGFNPVDYIPGYVRNPKTLRDVIATYPHRILLGSAMAMGWPLALSLATKEREKQRLFWISGILLIGGCYFAYSRGPWLASAIAGVQMFILGPSPLRKRMLLVIVLVLTTLAFRQGVKDVFQAKYSLTFDIETGEGRSYAYRWELWKRAYREVRKSPARTLFGYGQGSHHVMDLADEATPYDSESSFWSWDNDYACLLLEQGFVGLGLIIIVYGVFWMNLFRIWRRVDESRKNMLTGIIVSITVLLFMMTNVKIFAHQLYYLFWALLAIGFVLGRDYNGSVDNYGEQKA